MPKDELVKITVRIRRVDYDALCELFPYPVGINKAIRQIIETQVRILQEDINKQKEVNTKASEKEIASVGISNQGLDPNKGNGTPSE